MAEHNELGKKGEELARAFLKNEGYQILYTNWRFNKYEVDIIARFEEFLIVVEVKTRNTDVFGEPESFVNKKQQNHLAEAVESFLDLKPQLAMEVRYDVVSVIIGGKKVTLQHFPDAFWPDNLSVFSIE